MDCVVFENLVDHSFIFRAKLRELWRIVRKGIDNLGQRADGGFLCRAEVLGAQGRDGCGVTLKNKSRGPISKPLADYGWLAP